MSMKELVDYIDNVIKARYPRLPDTVMSEDAGLSSNTVHRIRQGVKPRPGVLKALAETWGRTPEEKARDFR